MSSRYMKRCSTSLAIREIQSKLQWDTTSHLSEWLSSTRQVITSVGDVMEKNKPTFTAGGNVHWCNHYGKQCGGSSIIMNTVTIWLSSPSTSYVPEKVENIYSQRYMHPYVHCSIIRGGQDLETTKGSFSRGFE